MMKSDALDLFTVFGDVFLHRIVFIIGRVTQGEDVGGWHFGSVSPQISALWSKPTTHHYNQAEILGHLIRNISVWGLNMIYWIKSTMNLLRRYRLFGCATATKQKTDGLYACMKTLNIRMLYLSSLFLLAKSFFFLCTFHLNGSHQDRRETETQGTPRAVLDTKRILWILQVSTDYSEDTDSDNAG